MVIIDQLPPSFDVNLIGSSNEGRALKLIRIGEGTTKVFLWSQMHGDEPTGTMALIDLLHFVQDDAHKAEVQEILKACSLYILPMVNPDGAARFTRRNSQQIDINRDYLETKSLEAQILKATHRRIEPQFGFNLHDQSDLWSVKGSKNPAALSFLAPASEETGSISNNRYVAMQLIAAIDKDLQAILPAKIGLFDDTYEPRAFGDNFQASGTATVLIEGGTIIGDQELQGVRKLVFTSILKGLASITNGSYRDFKLEQYQAIPNNEKGLFHIMIQQVAVGTLKTSIGINYQAFPNASGTSVEKIYTVADLGDLRTMHAHQLYNSDSLQIKGEVVIDRPANFELLRNGATILSFRNGILQPN